MSWLQPPPTGWHPTPIARCAWCNTVLQHNEGMQQGKDHICDDCIEEVHGDGAWDRIRT